MTVLDYGLIASSIGLGYCLGRWHAVHLLLKGIDEVLRKVGK